MGPVMQRARSFLYVTLGILALALSGPAPEADAQSATRIAVAYVPAFRDAGAIAIAENGDVWTTPLGTFQQATLLGNLFGGALPSTPVAAAGHYTARGDAQEYAILENGDVWSFSGAGALSASFHGNLFAPATESSPVVGAGQSFDDPVNVVLANGDVWHFYFAPGGFDAAGFAGNIFGDQPVMTQRETWGRIKADRR